MAEAGADPLVVGPGGAAATSIVKPRQVSPDTPKPVALTVMKALAPEPTPLKAFEPTVGAFPKK